MKKISILTISIFVIAFSARAQINKGSTFLGGGVIVNVRSQSGSSSSASNYNQAQFSISPSIGKAVSTNTVAGINLLYSYYQIKGNTSQNQKNSTYGAGAFIRKYKNLSNTFYIFAEGGLNLSYSHYNYSLYNSNDNYDSHGYGAYFNLTPGIAYSLTKRLQLEAGLQNLILLGYTHRDEKLKSNSDFKSKYDEFLLTSTLNPASFDGISIGFRFLLNKS